MEVQTQIRMEFQINMITFEAAQVCALRDAFATQKDEDEAYQEAKERFGACVLCGEFHTYMREIGAVRKPWPSCQLDACPSFMELSTENKANKVEENVFEKTRNSHCVRVNY